jgi:hypothetical protein
MWQCRIENTDAASCSSLGLTCLLNSYEDVYGKLDNQSWRKAVHYKFPTKR